MGFNKRRISGINLLSIYRESGAKAVREHIIRPDALFLPTGKSWAQDAYDLVYDDSLTEKDFERIFFERYADYVQDQRKLENLSKELHLADDHDTREWIVNKIMDYENKIKYWTR